MSRWLDRFGDALLGAAGVLLVQGAWVRCSILWTVGVGLKVTSAVSGASRGGEP